jgi:hypothetical protein
VPGLSADHVTDTGRLLAAHRETLEGSAFHTTRLVERQFPNGTVVQRARTEAWFGADGSYLVVRELDGRARERLGLVTRVEQYGTTEAVTRSRVVDDGNATYTPVGGAPPSPPARTALLPGPTAGREVLLAFAAVNASLAERITVDDERRYRFEGSGLRSIGALRSLTGRSNVSALTDFSLSAAVTRGGLVTVYELRYTDRSGSVPVRVTRAGTLSDVGETTVPRPAWYDERATATVSGNVTTRAG